MSWKRAYISVTAREAVPLAGGTRPRSTDPALVPHACRVLDDPLACNSPLIQRMMIAPAIL